MQNYKLVNIVNNSLVKETCTNTEKWDELLEKPHEFKLWEHAVKMLAGEDGNYSNGHI